MSQTSLEGRWVFHGRPQQGGRTGKGRIALGLRQHGTDLCGWLVQEIDPWTGAPPPDPEATRATVIGRVYPRGGDGATLLELKRLNHHEDFQALFIGILSPDGARVDGHVVNSRGDRGTFSMERA